ncbi:MAG: hypothetical protein UW78_C0018G0025, partial [Candidatus Azambacteria bacterium GW2011_GWA1_44_9]
IYWTLVSNIWADILNTFIFYVSHVKRFQPE